MTLLHPMTYNRQTPVKSFNKHLTMTQYLSYLNLITKLTQYRLLLKNYMMMLPMSSLHLLLSLTVTDLGSVRSPLMSTLILHLLNQFLRNHLMHKHSGDQLELVNHYLLNSII